MRIRAFLAVTMTGASLACSASVVREEPVAQAAAPAGPASPFPSAADTAKLAASPNDSVLAAGADTSTVDEWAMAASAPDSFAAAAAAPASPWEAALNEVVRARGGFVTAPPTSACAAREVGLFVVRHGKMPNREALVGMAALCGVAEGDIAAGTQSGEVQKGETDAAILKRWHIDLAAFAAQGTQAGHHEAGIWFGREGKRAALVLATAPRAAVFQTTSRIPDANGKVTLRGELLAPAEKIQGYINQGAFGAAPCEQDPQVTLPLFTLRCPVDRSDAVAWVQVTAFRPGRILGDNIMHTLVFPAGKAPTQWAAPRLEQELMGAGAVAAQVLNAFNVIRSHAGLPPLLLAAEQSDTAEKLVPHFYGGVDGKTSVTLTDQAALGLLAGWQVRAEVRDAHIAPARSQNPLEPRRLAAAVLTWPFGRVALLDRDAKWLAFGAAPTTMGDVGVLMATYLPVPEAQEKQRIDAFLARVQAARKAAHRDPALLLPASTPLLAEVAVRLRNGEMTDHDALQLALQRVADQQPGSPVRGWVLTAASVEQLLVPPELVAAPHVHIAASLTWVRPANSPRAHLVALVAVTESGETTARAD
jgi:hypothetical protein